jgi:mono/diheme cytochrome c family protein
MKPFVLCVAILPVMASAALGADAEAGKRLAQQECAVCHVVESNQRNETGAAPPFDVIARKFGADADTLMFDLMGPHAKMNFALRRRDAADVAEYIQSLVKDDIIDAE